MGPSPSLDPWSSGAWGLLTGQWALPPSFLLSSLPYSLPGDLIQTQPSGLLVFRLLSFPFPIHPTALQNRASMVLKHSYKVSGNKARGRELCLIQGICLGGTGTEECKVELCTTLGKGQSWGGECGGSYGDSGESGQEEPGVAEGLVDGQHDIGWLRGTRTGTGLPCHPMLSLPWPPQEGA